jgi:hypothetical protein
MEHSTAHSARAQPVSAYYSVAIGSSLVWLSRTQLQLTHLADEAHQKVQDVSGRPDTMPADEGTSCSENKQVRRQCRSSRCAHKMTTNSEICSHAQGTPAGELFGKKSKQAS